MRVGYKHRDPSLALKILTTLSLSIAGVGKYKTTFSTVSTGRLRRRKQELVAVRIRRGSEDADDRIVAVDRPKELNFFQVPGNVTETLRLGYRSRCTLLKRPEVSFLPSARRILEIHQVRTSACLAITQMW